MDLSYFTPALLGVLGGVMSELSGQNRVAGRLDGDTALRWRKLGGWTRYSTRRDLRRGRVVEDPELGAQVAALMSSELRGRRAGVFAIALLLLLFFALGVVALGHGRVLLAALEIAVAAFFAFLIGLRRRVRRRLAEAEEKNRAAADG